MCFLWLWFCDRNTVTFYWNTEALVLLLNFCRAGSACRISLSFTDSRPRKGLAMKRSFPWDEPGQNPDSSSNNIPLPIPSIDLTSQDILIRRAEMYQEYMKQIPIPSQRGSVIPFNSWMGLGKSIKQLYGQPLHYLTNVILKQWDQLRLNSKDEYKPLDNLIHPTKAEATIWLMEEVHRQTSSHFQIAELWKLDPMYNCSVDAIFPTSENVL
ncbi:hypothetical protein HN51_007568 [Arachis hypogaea]